MRSYRFAPWGVAAGMMLAVSSALVPHVSHAASAVVATPVVSTSGIGQSASFTVTFSSATAGTGFVLFGNGPGCSGLVGLAAESSTSPTTQHSVNVTGNQFLGVVGSMPIVEGATYYYEVETLTSAGPVIDNNNGGCYSVTIPSRAGAVYTESNASAGNSVMVYSRANDGTLALANSYPTGGTGTGAFTEEQGAVTLSTDHSLLFAVNAGSNQISSFRVSANGLSLSLASTLPSGGVEPVSVAYSNGYVYVLNRGNQIPSGTQIPGGKVGATISGYTVNSSGVLSPIPGSIQSVPGAFAGDIAFNPAGTLLAVSEPTTTSLYVFPMANGLPGASKSFQSGGEGAAPYTYNPFGFSWDRANAILAADVNLFAPNGPTGFGTTDHPEGQGAVTSYSIGSDGSVTARTTYPTGQSTPCWTVLSGSGELFVANLESGNISTFQDDGTGSLTLLKAAAGTNTDPAAMHSADEALDSGARWLYVLSVHNFSLNPAAPFNTADDLNVYTVGANGALTNLQTIPGLPASAIGLAAY